MKKVKTLNEDLIRKLIFETIDEVSLGEGRKKKKVEEAELSDEEARAQASEPYPPENEPDQPNPNPLAHTKPFEFNFEKFKERMEALKNTVSDPAAENVDREVAKSTFDTYVKNLKIAILGEEK